ncbi:MAG: restriction endonuclease subunit S [Candidatus Poribacteria bacterium]|nr:restriction endonuclease subunit S [Candidatus Poribacteria bacterium]
MSTHLPHIPDWKTVKLGEVTEIIKGGTPSRNVGKYFRGNIAWAIPSDITALDSFLYIDDTETHITEEALSNSAARLLPAGTVLLTSRATIGETAIATVPMATNQGFANFICREALLNVFLAYYLRYIKEKLNDLASGSTFKEVTKRTLLNIEIPLPPLSEQRAIAEALSDVDGLLNALEALIAKKQAIKQAVMQQLLTGKTRLLGFSGAWETKRLGEIAKIQKGSLITEKNVVPGAIPVIAGGQKPAYFHNTANRTGKTITVSGSGAYAGFVALHNRPIFASDCSTISESPSFSIDFIYYYLVYNQNTIYKAQTGGAQPHVHPVDLMPLQVDLPPLPEQEAIASVLSDMDAGIAALEQRRDKTRAIKQGMMQQLLTGRVRLSESRICTDDTD